MALTPQPSRRSFRPGYQLDPDVEKGFKEAVKGNQSQMALMYLEEIIARLQQEVAGLRTEIATLTETVTKLRSTAPTKAAKPAPNKDDSATTETTTS